MLKKMPHILFLFLIFGILLIGYLYFFQLSPTFVNKPVLEKPLITDTTTTEEKEITGNQIVFLLNELDAYKLHSNLLTGEKPLIKIKVDEKEYFFSVTNNQIHETEGQEPEEPKEPDLVLMCSSQAVEEMIGSEDISSAVMEAFSSGRITIEVNKDEKSLALMGYKAIYDKIYPQTGEITGNVIVKMNPTIFSRGINLALLVMVSLIIGLIIEKEI